MELIPLLNSLFPGMTGIDWEGVSETIKPASFSLSITGGLLMFLRKVLILSTTVLAVTLASASSSQHSVIVVINASNCYKKVKYIMSLRVYKQDFRLLTYISIIKIKEPLSITHTAFYCKHRSIKKIASGQLC